MVYDSLIEVLEESTAGASTYDLRRRLESVRDGIKTLLIAWARYEDKLPEGAPSGRPKRPRRLGPGRA